MKFPSKTIAALTLAALLSGPAFAHRMQRPAQHGPQSHDRGPRVDHPAPEQPQNRHYYNGQWVDSAEWQRHDSERNRWANRQPRRSRNDNGVATLASGIIGFALGAAIVGSQQQAQHAQSADSDWDNRCAARYRSYDRSSRTYLGYDGARHYCQ